jgi:putative FmdB family regulatory protein
VPTYEYRCRKCGRQFELFHSIKDETPKHCPRCRGRAVRVPASGAGLLFKGSGFYVTDHRSKSYKEKARQEKPGGGSTSGGKSSSGE